MGAHSRLGAYELSQTTGWTLIRAWALNQINTVNYKANCDQELELFNAKLLNILLTEKQS